LTASKTALKAAKAKPPATKLPKYTLAFQDAALAEWRKLDGSVKEPLRRLLKKRLDAPHVKAAALYGELKDCYKIKLRAQGYRLIYQVIDQRLLVLVISVGKRDKNAVYEAAIQRLRKRAAP
jgi:mRNA interferase RelE/StbE